MGMPQIFGGTSGKDSMSSLGDGTDEVMVCIHGVVQRVKGLSRQGVTLLARIETNQLALLMRMRVDHKGAS